MNWVGGGHIENIPKPWKRKFPGRQKRLVRVNINVYFGVGHHFHVLMSEENNPILCTHRDEHTTKDHWHEAYDDADARGRTFSGIFETKMEAHDWVRETFTKKFSTKTHKLRDPSRWDGPPRWFYREGD